MSFKTLSLQRLQGNQQRNNSATTSCAGVQQRGNFPGGCATTPDLARQLIQELADRSPGGECWGWIRKNCPDLWRSHIRALLASDATAIRATFDQMLTAWEARGKMEQQDLLP